MGDPAREQVQRFGDVPHQLEVRHIIAFFIGGQHIDMHQRGVAAVPHGRFVFHWAVTDADNQIRQMQQSVACLVVKEADTSGKAGEMFLIHRPGRLIGTGDRDAAFLQQLTQRGAVGRLAGHQPQ